ncbi:hypothetical protein, partial [Staphylococcus aureus]|uniref:hypothetical protein n=1 Tax=Staphylococcus aureus TaxID=1280 RepID=UPI001ED9A27A
DDINIHFFFFIFFFVLFFFKKKINKKNDCILFIKDCFGWKIYFKFLIFFLKFIHLPFSITAKKSFLVFSPFQSVFFLVFPLFFF